MRVGLSPICSAYVAQNIVVAGTNPPRFMFGIRSAITDGSGTWTFVADEAFLEEDVELVLTAGFGSNAGGKGISFGVPSMSVPGTFSVTTYQNDTGAAVGVPFYVTVRRRAKFSWD